MRKMGLADYRMQTFWNKKITVSYILAVLICVLHAYAYNYYLPLGDSWIAKVDTAFHFFQNDMLPRVAVPLFLMISGYLFFVNFTMSKYKTKLRSRVKSLLIPYLIWNTVGMLFQVATSFPFIAKYFVGRKPFEISVKNILYSVFLWRGYLPCWFLFALMVFAVISPLIYFLLKNKYVGIMIVAALIVLYQFGIELPAELFMDSDCIYYYLIGAYIGMHFRDCFANRSMLSERIVCTVLFGIALIMHGLYKSETLPIPRSVDVLILAIAAYTFWKVCDWFVKGKSPRPFLKRSFMVYLTHLNIVAVVSKLIYLALPKTAAFYIPNVIISVTLTLVLINLFCIALQKISPRFYSIVSGERGT